MALMLSQTASPLSGTPVAPTRLVSPTDKVFDPITAKASKLHDTENIFSNFWDKVTAGK